MPQETPHSVLQSIVDGINAGDLDSLMTLYEPGAVFAAQPGKLTNGLPGLREALSSFVAAKGKLDLKVTRVLEGADLALVIGVWSFVGTGRDGRPLRLAAKSADVLRRQEDGTWRFVIDFPFDDQGFSTAQDLARLDGIMERGARERVIAWLPRFLSGDRMRDVRRLVILDWLLTGAGERWRSNSDHLSEVDRAQARAILESQRTALREGLRRSIQEVSGATRIS